MSSIIFSLSSRAIGAKTAILAPLIERTVMRRPTRQEISGHMTTNRRSVSETDKTEGILAIVRGEFGDRQVDWKLRSYEGTLQNACDYYHDGELIHAGDWFRFEFVDVNESGGRVQFSELHGGGEMPFEEWTESVAEVYLKDELGEIWNDVKKMHDGT